MYAFILCDMYAFHMNAYETLAHKRIVLSMYQCVCNRCVCVTNTQAHTHSHTHKDVTMVTHIGVVAVVCNITREA